MRNDTCVECGQKFEPREGKLYCSEACNQAAYRRRKKIDEVEETPSIEGLMSNRYAYTFNMNEFIELRKDKRYEGLEPEAFSFIRKNLTGNADFDFIKSVFDLWDLDFANPEYNSYQQGQEYRKFVQLFHSTNLVQFVNEPLIFKEQKEA
jgi:hypothetical protein